MRARRTALGGTLLCATLITLACAPADTDGDAPDLVDVRALEPSIHADIRYATSDNFVGEPIDGYAAPICLLARPAAEALAAAQSQLAADGLGLIVYDCYRPQRAVDHFVRWARDTADRRMKRAYYPGVPKSRLFEDGYIAARSGHSRAATVDLTIGRLADAPPPVALDMGTPYDFFDPLSHTESPDVTADQRHNRFRLRSVMDAAGFRNYANEWWHYTLRDEPYPDRYFDEVVDGRVE